MDKNTIKSGRILLVVVLIAAGAVLASCEKYTFTPPAVDPNNPWSFQTDIQPIFNSNCVSCHAGTTAPDLREGKSYSYLTKNGYLSDPAESSKLYSKMISSGHLSRSSEADRLKVLYWLQQGAQNN
jgi:hypothetical protein